MQGGKLFVVTSYAIQWDFDLYFAVRTTDTALKADKIFTQRAFAEWSFNGSGAVADATAASFGTWTAGGAAGVTGDDSFEEKTNGDRIGAEYVKDDAPIVNDNLP